MQPHRNRAKNLTRFPRRLSLCAALVMAFAAHAHAAVIYTETFPNTSAPTAAQNFSTINWSAFIGATATDYTNTTNVTSSSPAVIWTTNGQGGGLSYGFASSVTTGALYYTTEPGALEQANLETITFYNNNGNTTATQRVAIRLDTGEWFASDTAFTHSAGGGSSGNWATNAQQKSFAFTNAASAWRDLTFVPDTSLALAAAARTQPLPAGNITAIGLYASGTSIRFDTFEVSAVPEPSALALIAAGLAPLLSRRRRNA